MYIIYASLKTTKFKITFRYDKVQLVLIEKRLFAQQECQSTLETTPTNKSSTEPLP